MMDDQMNVLDAPKKIVDGLIEVFEGFARMFEGVSEQLELLVEDAAEALEDKPEFPVKELPPTKVSGKKGASVSRPRKNPEKKNRKGDTVPVTDDAVSTDADVTPVDADPAEGAVKDTETAAGETTADSADSNLQTDTEDAPPWEEDTGQKEASTPVDDAPSESIPIDQPATTITRDDITAVIVAKIKQKRDNNAKIGQLLKAYGYSELSALPAEKYEAFLADISQL